MTRKDQEIIIREAVYADIDSLITIVPRSFASDAFLNQVFPPDSIAIRQWWAAVYHQAIDSPWFRILVAATESTIIGVLTLHLWRAELSPSASSGLCALVSLTADHSQALSSALTKQTEQRRQTMKQQPNYQIDLMAVDCGYQGAGIGKRLIWRACEIADDERAAIFLQTTETQQYYLKLELGFKLMDGGEGGTLIRPISVK